MWSGIRSSELAQQCRQKRYTVMTVTALFMTILALIITAASYQGASSLSTLRMVHIVFNHGKVTPSSSYPNDPHKNHEWKEGKLALTNKGKVEMYKLGQLIRDRYGDFLRDHYDPEAHIMESSYAPRCQMSAQLFLAGLFPPKSWQIWNTNLQWQPIPVNPIPRSMDNKIANKAKCRALEEEKDRVDRLVNKNLDESWRGVLAEVSQHAGQTYSNVSQAARLYYILKSQKENDLELPDWAEENFSALAMMTAIELASYSQNTLLKRLHTGPLLKEWVANMQNANMLHLKARFYSGHDLTLVALMNTLGYDKLDLPQYGAALAIEYHQNVYSSVDFIKVIYFKNSHPTPDHPGMETLILQDCPGDCTLQEFTTKIREFISWNDWDTECKNK